MPNADSRRAWKPWLLVLLTATCLPLLGPGCGGGGPPGDGDPDPCTTLPFGARAVPASLPAQRIQDLQVTIEVRFISVDDAFFEQVGIDFDFGVDTEADTPFTGFGTPGFAGDLGVFPDAVGGAETAWGLVQGTHPAGAPVPILHPGFIDPFQDVGVYPFLPWIGCLLFQASHTQGVSGLSGTLARPLLPAAPITPDFSLHGSFFSDIEAQQFLQTIQGDARSVVLTAPRVTLYDGQRATVQLRNRLQMVDDFDLPFAQAIKAAAPLATHALTGPTLDVTPTVTPDRMGVILQIRPGTQSGGVRFDGPIDIGPTPTPSGVEVPVIRTRGVRTEVTVPDGQTILLGGIKTPQDMAPRVGLPILRDIPVLSMLFATPMNVPDNQPLLILVTPRLIPIVE